MSIAHNVFFWYLGIINLLTILFYGWDKYCAMRQSWRVPEMTLLLLAAVGGSVGAWVAMQLFHHKTQHWKFRLGVPILLLLQIAGLAYVHFR